MATKVREAPSVEIEKASPAVATPRVIENGQKPQAVAFRGAPLEGLSLPAGNSMAMRTLIPALPKVVQLYPNQNREELRAFAMGCAVEMLKISGDVNPLSVIVAACNCASVGVVPGPARGHGYFVKMFDKQVGGDAVQFWMGYRGLIHLAYQTGFLKRVTTEVVLEGEKVRLWADDDGRHIEHDLQTRLTEGETGRQVVAAYMSWESLDGARDVFVVPGKDLYELAARQGKRGNSPYSTNPIAMFRKAPICRGSKTWHLHGTAGERFNRAVRLEEQAERGEQQDANFGDINLSGIPAPPAGPRPGDVSGLSDDHDGVNAVAEAFSDRLTAATSVGDLAAIRTEIKAALRQHQITPIHANGLNSLAEKRHSELERSEPAEQFDPDEIPF